jgi:hypothetical protein
MQEFDIRVMVDRLSRLYSEVLGSNTNVPADREECEPGHKEPARMPLLPATA